MKRDSSSICDVAGSHSALFEAYWNQIDPNGVGTVGAFAAARFLKKSGLSDVVLSRIWDLSDPASRGCLDKAGLFVALKLVSLAQMGRDLNMANISQETPPPKMGDPPPKILPPAKPPLPVSAPLITAIPPTAVDWSIKPTEREKYHQLFDSLQPLNGMIPGNKVKGVLMDSKLPLETLGKIWDLADMDKDGMLDRHEFIVAMHLVYKALEKHAIPATLPPELMVPNKRQSPVPVPIIPKVPPQISTPLVAAEAPKQPIAAVPWVVSSEDRLKFDAMFVKADVDKDGFVSGFEIKDVFLQSGVPQPVLAHIWALCDVKQTGKLNGEQFALAMWMVNRRLQGIDPPATLAPDMIPPSLRSGQVSDGIVNENTTATPYSNPELDMISKDIEELAREKLSLETDIAQKEADIKIKGGEIKSLQSELDTLTAALKQLENQKGEAQKRLNDLKSQVDKLRVQAEEQETALRSQEGEVTKRREQLEGLRQEQACLEAQCLDQNAKLDNLASSLVASQLQISQAKAKITQLQEQQRHMKDALSACDIAIESGDVSLVPDTSLRITPEFRDPEYTRVAPLVQNGDLEQNILNETQDPFSNQNGHVNSSGFEDDPFKSDPFKNTDASEGFGSNDPFSASFPTKASDGFSADPFGTFDNTNNNNNNAGNKTDPFDPFGDKSRNAAKSPALDSEKDEFGCDPFAILHAPTRDGGPPGRPSSPSPALPPKKGKTPPPRPAPPRPLQGPTGRSSATPTPDPFSSVHTDAFGGNPGGFANFADFDAKFSKQKSTLTDQSSKKQRPETAMPSTKSFDFTDDPFRDYRYEDPFNITDPFDDKPATSKSANGKTDAFGAVFSTEFEKDIGTAQTVFCQDSFDGRASVPLPKRQQSLMSKSGRASAPIPDPFAVNNTISSFSTDRFEWATDECSILEEQKRRKQQEQADYEYALALSKAESTKS